MSSERENLLRYYWQELSYLREQGARFAQRHPKIAARLELEPNECADPHVERLIEAFAFLTGRIQRSIDNEFPEVATELLELLHPHYLRPIPSMSIAQFEVDYARGKITEGYTIPRHTQLFTESANDEICRFRTCYPVDLWPLEVSEVHIEPPSEFSFLDRSPSVASTLRLRVQSHGEAFRDLAIDHLRFFLDGESILVAFLYELIFSQALRVVVLGEVDGRRQEIPIRDLAVSEVGFGVEEEALPYPATSQPAYRLLQEYFAFPQKFLFFDLSSLENLDSDQAIDILFLLPEPPAAQHRLEASNFLLHTTPIINLFPQSTEPIRVDHRRSEYRLVPNARREKTTEIYEIHEVFGSDTSQAESRRVYTPFYSFQHSAEEPGSGLFWHARRVPAVRPDLNGTDLYLSLVDVDFKPKTPPGEAVYARTLCTNRRLAERIPALQRLECDTSMPVSTIRCLMRPSTAQDPPLSGQKLWQLVSHLSLNHLSLSSDADSLSALRELLTLYSSPSSTITHQQIRGITGVRRERAVHRTGKQAWRGFCQGDRITLTLDEDNFQGTSAFLLGAVLNRFFALYCSTNSFTQLVLRKETDRPQEEWMRWPPMAGERALL